MDTHNLGAGAGTFFEMGQRGGGRLSGVGQSLKVLVDTLKEDKALRSEIEGQKEILGYKAKLEKENRSPLEDIVDLNKVLSLIETGDKLGLDMTGVLKGGRLPSQGITTEGQDITGLGSPQVVPVKAQVDEGYEIVPSGELKETVFGGQKVGYKVQPTEARSLRAKLAEQRALQELKSEVPTAQKQNDLTAAQQQLSNIKGMRTLAESIPSGIVGRVGSGTLAAVSGGAMSTNKQLYDKQRPAFAVSLYRALTGDTRLSDADAKARALPLLWKVGEADAVRKKSFDYIEKALQSRINLIQSGKYKQNKEGDFITPFEDVLAGAEQIGTLDADTASQILQEAGGDKNRARAIAKERGYTF